MPSDPLTAAVASNLDSLHAGYNVLAELHESDEDVLDVIESLRAAHAHALGLLFTQTEAVGKLRAIVRATGQWL